jgi:hypothetical protein
MKRQGNIIPPKEYNNFLETTPRELVISEWSEKELKIII